ncbi:MAG: hypothetical protein U0790_00795 [Isosphaeraceae bacterium]
MVMCPGLREGTLEHLLCLTNSKEHESILATDAPAVQIHAAGRS